MGILYERLMILLNEAEPGSAESHIAYMMLQNLASLAGMTIGQVAELCGVSKSTVSKFVNKLGYASYKDFRDAAIFEENKYGNSQNYLTNVIDRLNRFSVEEYAENVCSDLMLTARTLDRDNIDRLAQDLMDHKIVVAFGLMFSQTAAEDLQTKLGYLGKFIYTSSNDIKQEQSLRSAGPDTLAIIFSESGGYLDRYGAMIDDFSEKDTFSATKAKVVLISANEKALHDPRIAYGIHIRRTTGLRSHAYTFELITDAIAQSYRRLVRDRRTQDASGPHPGSQTADSAGRRQN